MERWLTLHLKTGNQLSSPDDMGCPGFSSCCFTEIDVPIVKQYTKPWTFTSSDGRFEAEFVPVLDRAAKIDVKFIITDQHQVFGRLTGKCILDDGTVLEFKDVLCFAEDVHNKY